MKKAKTINEYSAPETIVVDITLGHIVLGNASNETLGNVEEGNAGDDWYD